MKKQLFIFAWVLALSPVFFVPRGFCIDCGQISGLLDREFAAQSVVNGDLEKCRLEIIASIKDARFSDCWGKSAGPDDEYASVLGDNVAQHVISVIHDKAIKQAVLKFAQEIQAGFYGGNNMEAFKKFSAGFTESFFNRLEGDKALKERIYSKTLCNDDKCRYWLGRQEGLPPEEYKKRMDEFTAILAGISTAKAEASAVSSAQAAPAALTATAPAVAVNAGTGPKSEAPAGRTGMPFPVLLAAVAAFLLVAAAAGFLVWRRKTDRNFRRNSRAERRVGKSVFPRSSGRENADVVQGAVPPPPVAAIAPEPAQSVAQQPTWTKNQEADLNERLDGLYAEIVQLRAFAEAERSAAAREASSVSGRLEALVSRSREDFHNSQKSFFKVRAKSFFEKNRALYEVVVNEVQSRDRELYRKLISELPELLAESGAVAASFADASAALAVYQSNVAVLEAIIRALKEEDRAATPNTPERYHLINTFLNQMDVFQYSGQIPVIAGFKPEKWVRESFLGVADLVIKEHQRLSPGQDAPNLSRALWLALEVLSRAGVETETIVLCETRFDSKNHVVRSTVNRTDLPDGVITDVVRNGFFHKDGRSIQQAEVIVNRSRA
ncbi:MAG: hypothetical protein HZB23_09225 [Deltaproteobacteria bacterium]|nr:hypothetical protein [Deltaproteobacteria bacterium]